MPDELVTWTVRLVTTVADARRTSATFMLIGGVPVAATAALVSAGVSRSTAAATRAGRRCGPDSSRRRGCHASRNSERVW